MGKQWAYFQRTTEQQERMSVLVDASHQEQLPIQTHPRLLSVVINLYALAAQSSKRADTTRSLAMVERRLEQVLAGKREAIYAGRINTPTRLEFYYYATADDGTEQLQQIVTTALADLPQSYRWIVSERDDADWSFYTFLLPDAVEQLYAKNSILLRSLAEKGDQLQEKRPVYHWVRFATKEQAEQAIGAVVSLDYELVSVEQDEQKPAFPYLLIVRKVHEMAVDQLNRSVQELHVLAADNEGEYGGWGTDMRLRRMHRWLLWIKARKKVIVWTVAGIVVIGAGIYVGLM